MKINVKYKTDIGLYRKMNQDALLFLQNNSGQAIAAVCDGLGGHHCGEVASQIAVAELAHLFDETNWIEYNDDEKIKSWLKQAVRCIQKAMDQYSVVHKEANDMGTTMVVVLIISSNNTAYFINIGDSRIYLFVNKQLRQLTTDHNILNELKTWNQNLNTEDLSKTYWKALTSALGPEKKLTIDIFQLPLPEKCYFLLTSDGVHDFLEPETITMILQKHNSLKTKVKILIDAAKQNVSTDNLTAMIIGVKC